MGSWYSSGTKCLQAELRTWLFLFNINCTQIPFTEENIKYIFNRIRGKDQKILTGEKSKTSNTRSLQNQELS